MITRIMRELQYNLDIPASVSLCKLVQFVIAPIMPYSLVDK